MLDFNHKNTSLPRSHDYYPSMPPYFIFIFFSFSFLSFFSCTFLHLLVLLLPILVTLNNYRPTTPLLPLSILSFNTTSFALQYVLSLPLLAPLWLFWSFYPLSISVSLSATILLSCSLALSLSLCILPSNEWHRDPGDLNPVYRWTINTTPDQKKLNMTTPLILFKSLLEGIVDKLWNQSLLEYLSAWGMCSTSPDRIRSKSTQ